MEQQGSETKQVCAAEEPLFLPCMGKVEVCFKAMEVNIIILCKDS